MRRKRRNLAVEIPKLWQPKMRYRRLLELAFPKEEYPDVWADIKANRSHRSGLLRSFAAALKLAGFERNHADVVVRVCWAIAGENGVLLHLPCFRSEQEAARYIRNHNIDKITCPVRMGFHS